MSIRHLQVGSVVVLMFATSSILADTKIKRSDLPVAVEKTVQQQSVGAMIKGFSKEVEHGQLSYEVEMTVNGHGKDVSIAKDGTVLVVEEETALDALPAAVKSALLARAKGAKITKVESVTKKDKLVSYEAATLAGTKRGEVAVGPNGEALAHED